MKPAILLVSAVVLSVSLSYAVARVCPRSSNAEAATSADAEELSRLGRGLAEAEERERALAEELRKLREEIAVRSSSGTRVPEGEIEAAVARAVAAHREAGSTLGEAAAGEANASPTPAAGKAFDAQAAFEELTAPGLSEEQRQEKWKALADAGKLDEMVALFEKYAKDHPDSPMAHVELGGAYLQKVFQAGNGPEAGVWAVKADKSFDSALGVDDHCWEARFSKAVSLSFWPPVFGKQNEAIKHFEILTEQQAQGSDPKFAQTWLLLGNMYQQTGRMDQALATWQKGLQLFLGNASLLEQIANAQR